MPIQTSPQQPRNTNTRPSPSQTAVDIVRQSADLAASAADTLASAKLPQAAKAMLDVAKIAVNSRSTISQLDKAMTNLEQAAPGTSKLISDTATLFSTTTKTIPPSGIPASFKPLAKDFTAAASSFETFAQDYKAYQQAPDYSLFSPSSWGAKTAAAAQAIKSWSQFKSDFAKVDAHVQQIPGLNDPVLRGAAKDAVNIGIQILDDLLK